MNSSAGEFGRNCHARAHGVNQFVVGGSYRRRKETVGDIDILVTASPREPVLDQLVSTTRWRRSSREDRGEIDAARAGRLPRLVELAD